MAGTPSPGSGHLKIPLPHDPTDRPYDACLRPIFLRRDRSGPGPAEDRPAIFGRALLQRFGPTSRPQAQRKPLPDTERLQRHQHGSGPAYPEHLSVAELELASRRGGGPRGSRPDFCRGRFRRGALPSALSRPALFGPGLSAWGGSTNSVSFLAVSQAEAAVSCCSDALSPHLLPGDCMLLARTPAESIVFGRAYVVVVGEARLCRIIRKGESPERVRLVSLKPGKYDEIAVPRTEIDGLYRICGTFRYWAD